jgi:hypothetical protein
VIANWHRFLEAPAEYSLEIAADAQSEILPNPWSFRECFDSRLNFSAFKLVFIA